MNKANLTWLLGAAVVVLVVFGVIITLVALSLSDSQGLFGHSSNRVALVKVEGLILDSRKVIKHLNYFADDARVKAIVLRVETPGGGVSASQEIYQEVRRLREEKKKTVVVSMGSVAASGGYYIACGADRIVANPGTITGSIGVIAEWYNYESLVDKVGLKQEVIKSGALKDMGSPVRQMTEEERKLLQQLIDRLYGQFVGVVVAARTGKKDLDETRIRALADGRVFTGDEAVENGLVDELGTERTAVTRAAEIVGIKGEPVVVEPPSDRPVTIFDLLTKTDVADIAAQAGIEGSSGARIQFGYVWK